MVSGDGEDYVADSEDEATKNFKDRVRTRWGGSQAHPWAEPCSDDLSFSTVFPDSCS